MSPSPPEGVQVGAEPVRTPLPDNPERAEGLAEMLKAVAHPLRLRLIAALCEREWRVSELVQRLGTQQALISQQLRILRMSGLVWVERRGGTALYRLAEPRLKDLIACVNGCRK
jgi:ArsR family transcriptional regulator